MSTAENEAIVRRWLEEGWNQGNLAVVDELFAAGYVLHGTNGSRTLSPEQIKRIFVRNRIAFPDLHLTIEDMIAAGDKVVTRWTARGTHRGEFRGTPPTGRPVTWTGITIERIANGRITEAWDHWDELGLLRQLGAIAAAEVK
jgi:steroid delta-isomerase-like uncharacterized protein